MTDAHAIELSRGRFRGRRRDPDIVRQRSPHWFPYALLAPSILLLLAFLVLPFFYLFYWSTFDYKIGVTNEFVGDENFTSLLAEHRFRNNVRYTLIYVIGNLVISVPIAYFGAVLVSASIRGSGLLRTFLLIPWVLAPIVTALMAKTMLNPFDGPLIDVIAFFNGGEKIYPTLSGNGAMVVLIVHAAWRSFPLIMLLLAAGMSAIDPQVYEAAQVDGASRWQQFRRITLPLTRVPLLSGVAAISVFTFHDAEGAFALTGGGPGNATEVMGVRIFKEAFSSGNIGRGAAVGVALVIVSLAVLAVQVGILGRDNKAR
jgi:ABC-type sugar transport system permease subunit